MMREARPLAGITTEALKILCREIGVVDTLRFVRAVYDRLWRLHRPARTVVCRDNAWTRIVEEIKGTRKHGHS